MNTVTVTPADWWVTAGQSCDAVRDGLDRARVAPDLLSTLSELERARRASSSAVGAAVQALLASGVSWERIAAALGAPSADDAREAVTPLLGDADRALERRLT
jgi:hypothetical protein